MNRTLKIIIPVAVVALAALGAVAMVKGRKPVETTRAKVPPPLVRVLAVQKESRRLTVRAWGTVTPRTESALVAEVSGRVVSVSPSIVAGGFFEKGDVLVTLDSRDFELALTQARSQVAQYRVRLAREESEAEVARQEWESLGQGEADPLVLREPQLAEARAALESAKAALERAELDLERTRLRAPYAGRVREENVDAGDFVNRGTPMARIYAVDYAEVRLPIPDDQLAYLDLPLDYRGETARRRGPRVVLRASFAGREYEWEGRIVRTEGEIDPQSRMIHAVARVEDPYKRGSEGDRPPLAVGMFVEGEILGREVADVVILPRAALRGYDQVLVVDDEDRLHFRRIDVLRAAAETAIVSDGLEEGERVCLSPIDAPVDGMSVRTLAEENADFAGSRADGDASVDGVPGPSHPETGTEGGSA